MYHNNATIIPLPIINSEEIQRPASCSWLEFLQHKLAITTTMAKRLRSIPPDVTVVVGTVPNAQSFSVYKLALCFASPYFDTMLSSGMREDNTNSIELPDKDPEEWKAFYSIIDPSQIGQVQSESSIDEDNAVMLTKWFHEFQMVRGSLILMINTSP